MLFVGAVMTRDDADLSTIHRRYVSITYRLPVAPRFSLDPLPRHDHRSASLLFELFEVLRFIKLTDFNDRRPGMGLGQRFTQSIASLRSLTFQIQ